MMILFFHGFNSSAQTNKFVELQGDKVCETVEIGRASCRERV